MCIFGEGSVEPSSDRLGDMFPGYLLTFYSSGTAALAAAIMAAIRAKESIEPEVILPAYACPDLISAVMYAGAKPVLVDLAERHPLIDIDQLCRKINSKTVAVIAAHFLGIPERLGLIKAVTQKHGALLIEDSAQAFPVAEVPEFWQGDLVVVSFGRGKPVSLLQGGAVLSRNMALTKYLPKPSSHKDRRETGIVSFTASAIAYNILTQPRIFWLPNRIPGLGLGLTRFRPLQLISSMPEVAVRFLRSNIQRYRSRQPRAQQWIKEMLQQIRQPGIFDVAQSCALSERVRLLRYPILVQGRERKGRLLRKLQKAGLGASPMYPAPLPEIRGLETHIFCQKDEFPRAKSFAEELITLPTHCRVRKSDIEKIGNLIISIR